MYSVELVAPYMWDFIVSELGSVDDIDFFISHTGGKRILDEIERCLQLNSNAFTSLQRMLKTYR